MGYRTIEFINKGKEIPIVQSFVFFEPVPEHERKSTTPEELETSTVSAKGSKKVTLPRLAKHIKGLVSKMTR
jgi:hypothetical protein